MTYVIKVGCESEEKEQNGLGSYPLAGNYFNGLFVSGGFLSVESLVKRNS
jgi:hypothetical protein